MDQKDQIVERLRQAVAPSRSPGYWEAFPRRVLARLDEPHPATTGWLRRWALAASLAAAVAAAGILLIRQPSQATENLAKVYKEVAEVFPEQVAAIVADDTGVRLVLTDRPRSRTSPPLLVSACKPTGRRSIVTFSGEQVPVNGDTWDVLLDGEGRVIVAGRTVGNYRIKGGML